MGELSTFDLQPYITNFGISTLVETGTGGGDGIAYACRFPLTRIISIEIIPQIAANAIARFVADSRVTVINAKSVDGLSQVLPDLALERSVLFWLDGHYPGCGYGGSGNYHDPMPEDVRLPLELEMRLIREQRPSPAFRDVLLIDDRRVYEPGPYTRGPLPWPITQNAAFVNALYEDSHVITRTSLHEGYFSVEPV
jgi:hypothetical protein